MGRQLGQKASHDVSPRLFARPEMQRLDGFFGRLLGGKAGPLMAAAAVRILGVLHVAFGLMEPVARTIRHRYEHSGG